jgi:RNA polymerase sigma-70 factor, ECF subfamily
MMNIQPEFETTGLFEARYVAFLETIAYLRPRLHRYCARITGSILDGEDVMQEALFEAYRKLETYDDSRPLGPWLFGIAHNRCIDFLRKRGVRDQAEAAAVEPDWASPVEPVGRALDRAVERLVVNLPPKERACVLLKDVFDYSLDEIADLVGSTVGGVKAALKRGRSKLAALGDQARTEPVVNPELSALFRVYVERFNRRDWDGLRELISADAQLRVANHFAGRMADAPYLGEYERAKVPWRMAVGRVDGEPVIIMLTEAEGSWTPTSFVRLDAVDGRITQIRDYLQCPWILRSAAAVEIEGRA